MELIAASKSAVWLFWYDVSVNGSPVCLGLDTVYRIATIRAPFKLHVVLSAGGITQRHRPDWKTTSEKGCSCICVL